MDCDSSFPDEKSAKYLWSQGEEMEGCFEGWQDYPTNLNHYDPMLEDGQRYQDRLEDLSGSLFSDKVALHVIDANDGQEFIARSVSLLGCVDVETHFQATLPKLRVISIPRKHSLLNFRITKELLCKVLTRHQVNSCFLDLLFGFRAEEEISEKGYGTVCAYDQGQGQYNICYQLRYVERNEHLQGRRWSERQIGVYHSFSRTKDSHAVMILLHAMMESRAQKRLESVFAKGQYREISPTSPLRLHILVFSTYLEEWRWYMNHLGESCLRLENEGFTAEIESKADRSLTFRTLQEIRNIESKILTAKSILTATCTTLQKLEAVAVELDSRHSYTFKESKRHNPDDISREIVALARLSRQCRSYSDSAEVMESRAAKLIDLLSDGLDQKAQGTSTEINSSLLNLTQRSVDENVTVRVVTIITLIYLPTQFVATFFGTNFVVFQTEQRTIEFAQDFWIFIAIAIPLTIFTLSIWLFAIRREKRAKEKATVLEAKPASIDDPSVLV